MCDDVTRRQVNSPCFVRVSAAAAGLVAALGTTVGHATVDYAQLRLGEATDVMGAQRQLPLGVLHDVSYCVVPPRWAGFIGRSGHAVPRGHLLKDIFLAPSSLRPPGD